MTWTLLPGLDGGHLHTCAGEEMERLTSVSSLRDDAPQDINLDPLSASSLDLFSLEIVTQFDEVN